MFMEHSEILLSHKNYEILMSVTTWIDLEGVTVSGISQMKKARVHLGVSKVHATDSTEHSRYLWGTPLCPTLSYVRNKHITLSTSSR